MKTNYPNIAASVKAQIERDIDTFSNMATEKDELAETIVSLNRNMAPLRARIDEMQRWLAENTSDE